MGVRRPGGPALFGRQENRGQVLRRSDLGVDRRLQVTGKQVAVAPAAPGSIPLQLVKAEPATGSGAMSGISYIQRLNTQGGMAPKTACTSGTQGARQQVAYQADYVFYGS